MADIALFLKNNLKSIPPFFGKIINFLPFSYRPGLSKIYKARKLEIDFHNYSSVEQKKEFIFQKVASLTSFAYDNVAFYKSYYDSLNFHPRELVSFQDLKKIPIITKSILNSVSLEERSSSIQNKYVVNTGGSSGTPFSFYIQASSMGHEWAHMHTIWDNLGYKQSDFKLSFGGRSDVENIVDYDVVRNNFSLDIYASFQQQSAVLKKVLKKYKIKYLHGYPSSIYNFAKQCEESEDHELLNLIKVNLVGAFLGSEYPHKHYREEIERIFDIKTISWYGHTERAILAYEKEDSFKYHPFLTYGFSEVTSNTEGTYDLISTSYYNYATPLIRYNTEDTVTNVNTKNGILENFSILNGRSGEDVIDLDGNTIALTALIFGRHHELFNYVKFIQVKLVYSGIIEVHYVPNDNNSNLQQTDAQKLFDKSNLNFEISFVKRKEPYKTISGKVNLLIK